MSSSEYILNIKSVSSASIKTLFEVIKEILVKNINIVFTKDSMKVIEIDGTDKALVYLILKSTAFQVYHCEGEVITGVNAGNIFKIIKMVTNNDTVSFCIRKDNPGYLVIRLENSEKNKVLESEIELLNKKYVHHKIPDKEFQTEIILSSIELQSICKNLNSLGDIPIIEIKSTNDQLIFNHKGSFSDQKIIYQRTHDETLEDPYEEEIIQGFFNLKFILLFTKATKLSNNVKLYLANDYALVLDYSIGDSGNLRFILAPESSDSET